MTDPTVGYGTLSYWHDTAPIRPASWRVEPGQRLDVVIVGGGYTGLWTAYHLLARHPGLSVTVLEREESARSSGRNGGFAMTRIGNSLHQMVRDHGVERTWAVQHATSARSTVDRDGRARRSTAASARRPARRGHERDPGAQGPARPRGRGAAPGTAIHELSEGAVQGKVHSPTYRMAMEEDCCAVVHPAKLAGGLADIVVAQGVSLFERVGTAAMTDEGARVRSTPPTNRSTAGRGSSPPTPGLRDPALSRRVLPMYSYIIATEPLSDEAWEQVGWSEWQAIEDKRVNLLYYRRTRTVGSCSVAGTTPPPPIPDRAALRPQRAHLWAAPGELRPHLPAARRGPLHPCLGWAGGHDHRLPAAVRQPLAAAPLRRRLLRPRGRLPPTSAARSWSTS